MRAKELAELNENAWKKAPVSFGRTVLAIIAANRARAEAEQVTNEDKKQTRPLDALLRFESRIRVWMIHLSCIQTSRHADCLKRFA